MRQQTLEVVVVDGVEDVEEVVARRQPALWELVGEVDVELGVALEVWPERFHAQLIVVGHLDPLDGLLVEESLLLREDVLQEVFVDLRGRRQVELEARKRLEKVRGRHLLFVEVIVKVLLRLEATRELMSHQHIVVALLACVFLTVFAGHTCVELEKDCGKY